MPKFEYVNGIVEAFQVTVDNMVFLEHWCGGSIKGTKLPYKDRVIEIESEDYSFRAGVGAWIVRMESCFMVLTDTTFHLRYREI